MTDTSGDDVLLVSWRRIQQLARDHARDDSKYAVLPLIFLKSLYDQTVQPAAPEGGSALPLQVRDGDRFGQLVRGFWEMDHDQRLEQRLDEVLRELARRIPSLADIGDVNGDFFGHMMAGNADERHEFLVRVMHIIKSVPCRLSPTADRSHPFDVFLDKYASLPGQSSGIGHCPHGVAELLTEIVDPRPGERIYHPGCGFGDILLPLLHRTQGSFVAAQEAQGRTRMLGAMRLALHGFPQVRIAAGNLPHASHDHYDAIIADLSRLWDLRKRDDPAPLPGIFRAIDPRTGADQLRAICTSIDFLAAHHGRAALLIPHGPLFRQGPFREMRRVLLAENLLDAIIGLPSGILHATKIPVAVLVIKNTRKTGVPITVMDASGAYLDGRFQNVLRPDVENARIIDAYRQRRHIAGFCRQVSPDEIHDNDELFSPSVYIPTRALPEPPIAAIEDLTRDIADIDQRLAAIIEQRQKLFATDLYDTI